MNKQAEELLYQALETELGGEQVYKTAIEFWHGVDEGFKGRKAIDQEFRDHHKGDRSQ